MVFFFGCSRTASKAYMHLFHEHSNLHFTRELHLFSSISKRSFIGKFLKYRFNHKENIELSQNLGKLKNASYWRSDDYDAAAFCQFLDQHGKTKLGFWELVRMLMEFDRVQHGKEVAGAKFPLNVAYYPVFRKVFSASQYVFLARLPKDIIFSQFNKHEMKGFIPRMVMILYMATMFNFTVFYGLVVSRKKSYFIKFEDFKSNREDTLRGLCKYLGVPFKAEMLDLPVLGSRMKSNADSFQMKSFEKVLLNIITWPWMQLYKRH